MSIWSNFVRKLGKKRLRFIGNVRRLFGLEYSSPVTEEGVFDLVRGKRVAVVGNAKSLSDTTFGEEIDDHDLILRFKYAPIPSTASHGSRTDVIATSAILERSLMIERGASHIFWMSPPRNALPRWIVRLPSFFLYPRARHQALCAKVGNPRPTSGLMVIDLLSRSPCKSVDLYGFDFYQSGSFSGQQTKETTPHDYDAEEDFVLRLVRSDPRFSLRRSEPVA